LVSDPAQAPLDEATRPEEPAVPAPTQADLVGLALDRSNSKHGGRRITFAGLELSATPDDVLDALSATLTVLNLRRNNLGSISSLVRLVPSLVHLDVSENQLVRLPDMAPLQGLETIKVSDNPLTALPGSLFELPALHRVDASRCRLASMPSSFAEHCGKLTEFRLANNALGTLMCSSLDYERLVVVSLAGNPLVNLPVAVVAMNERFVMLTSKKRRLAMVEKNLTVRRRVADRLVEEAAKVPKPGPPKKKSSPLKLPAMPRRVREILAETV